MNKSYDNHKSFLSIIMFIIYVIVLIFLISYVLTNENILNSLRQSDPIFIIVGISTTVISVFFSGIMDVTCARAYGLNINLADSVIFSFIASAVNTVLPLQMGSGLKAIYYKRKTRLSYSKYVSIMAGTIILSVVTTLVSTLIMIMFVFSDYGRISDYTFFTVACLFIIILGLLFLNRFRDLVKRVVPLKRITIPILDGFYELMLNKKTVFLCVANVIVCNILGGVRFYAILSILGINKGFSIPLMYYCITFASGMIPIIPGNVGISEGIIGVILEVMDSGFDIGVTLVLINRIYYYLVTLIGALLCAIPAWIMYKKTQRGIINGKQ